MNKKKLSILVSVPVIIGGLLLSTQQENGVDQLSGLNRNITELVYTKHARCRMDCRHFTEKEILEILKDGKLNKQKSQPEDLPCPSYALEGTTSDGQKARVIFASCDQDMVKVITCIDLNKKYKCDCN